MFKFRKICVMLAIFICAVGLVESINAQIDGGVKPDLIIKDMSFEINDRVDNGYNKKYIDFTIKYKNQGSVIITKPFYIGYDCGSFINTSLLTTHKITDQINIGEDYYLKSSRQIMPNATFNTRCVVYVDQYLPFGYAPDLSNVIDESREDNNIYTKMISVKLKKPDLWVKDVSFVEYNSVKIKYCTGDSANIIQPIKHSFPDGFLIKLTVNDITHDNASTTIDYHNNLFGDNSKDFIFSVPDDGYCHEVLYPLGYFNANKDLENVKSIKIELDWKNDIAESNENNNTFPKTINLRSTDSGACSDSDGGQNYFSKGEASKTVNGYTTGAFDTCLDTNTLYEAYCSNVNVMNETYKCSNGCKDGACVAATIAKPDLTFGNISFAIGFDASNTKSYIFTDDISIQVNERIFGMAARVENNGQKDVELIEVEIKVYDPSNDLIYTNIEKGNKTLNAGAGRPFGAGWSWIPSKVGKYTCMFNVDPNSLIDESNENNNTFTKTINIGGTATGKDETYYSTNLKTDRNLYQAPEKIILELWSYSKNSNVSSDSYFVDIWLTKILKQGTIEKELIEPAFKVSTRGFSSFKEIDITQNDYFNKNGSGEYSFTVCKVNACAKGSNSSSDATFTVIMPVVSELIISNVQVPTSLIPATVTWKTNLPSNSDVHYWKADNIHEENWNRDKIDDYTQTNHTIVLKDLKPFTTYYFTVSSRKEGGIKTTSEQMSFTTTSIGSVIDNKIDAINNIAKNLNENKFDQILAEIKTLKDIIKEQQVEIKYLKTLKQDVKKLSAAVESAINNFITYGVDENTKKLGEGERAAVMHSYKATFAKLPETEEELADAIKIASGRWPSITNNEAEKKAKEQFQKIYKRIPDMNNAKDNAAVTVMSYGLRQRAENRNLNSEKAGINIFKGIYKKLPSTTEEWNIMQAITYSGAARETDTDGDLLPDWREDELGTDKNKKDTDGDGYTDGSEVLNGFDPLEK